MVKIKLILLLCFITFLSYGQNNLNEYSTYYNINKNYKIYLEEKEDYVLHIEMKTFDRVSNKGGMFLNKENHKVFLETLEQAKLKYIEWSKVATDNEIVDLNKTMIYNVSVDCYFLYNTDINNSVDSSVNLSFDFTVLNKTNRLLLVKTGPLINEIEEYKNNEGFFFGFSSVKEIDEFINIISLENVEKFMKKPKVENLFKD